MLKLNRIYHYDALEGLEKIDNNSIDLIITSPPYNLGNNHHTGSKYHQSYNDNMPEEKYQEWQIKVLNECFRVLKTNGSMIYNHKNRIQNHIQITPYEWLLKTKFYIKQEIVWINRSQNFDKIRFFPWTERLYWLAKSKKTKLNNILNKYDVFDWKEWPPVGTNGKHTRAFPLQLVVDILYVFPQSKIILDPFIGRGTTAIASKYLEKSFIGFDNKIEYVKLSNKNLTKKFNSFISNLDNQTKLGV